MLHTRMPVPVRLWSAGFVASVALIGGLLELALPDGVYAEGRPVRMWIEAQGLPDLVVALGSGLVRAWVSVALLVPVVGVGTAAGALLLAAVNWRRMRQPHAATVHVLLAFVIAATPRAKLFSEGVYGGNIWVGVLHLALAAYLFIAQRRVQTAHDAQPGQTSRRANVLAGVAIALLGAAMQSALSYVGIALAVQTNAFFISQAR